MTQHGYGHTPPPPKRASAQVLHETPQRETLPYKPGYFLSHVAYNPHEGRKPVESIGGSIVV
jgi:hypothetical protein